MLESDKINKVSMQIPTDKIYFNQTDDRSIQEIKLPTIWKHVLNDNSKVVETFPAKMAEVVNNHYRTERFSAPECHSNENISAEKKKTSNNDNDFRLRRFELEYNFSSYQTAISYRKDFNWTKF